MIESRDLLLEIGTEELPPLALKSFAEALFSAMKKNLEEAKLTFNGGKYFATPRRLAVLFNDVTAKQDNQVIEQKGPGVKAAFAADGTPTAACVGFARSCGVDVEKLERKVFGNEERLVCTITKNGATTQKLLPELVTKSIKEIPIPKAMRWGEGSITFSRPVRWVVLLFGSETIAAEIMGEMAGNNTFGHRFHHPEAITISEPKQYEELLETKGYVIPDFAKRKQMTWEKIQEVAVDAGIPLQNDELLDEITSLVEWPVALLGKFEPRFLHLPKEVLILVMEKQQRYFPLIDEDNKLTPYFILVSNIESKKPESVISGNENVIRARFVDAEFFYTLDTRYVLEGYIEKLQQAVFQTDLGTLYDKVLRVSDLSVLIAKHIGVDQFQAKRAAELSKFDLMTAMVGEFPELQGIMGSYYALEYHEPEEVAIAIKEQYLPKGAADILPQTNIGAVLSLADRIDTLVGIFSLKKLPTGDKDPFGLRRAAFGIIRIILEKNLDLDLLELLATAIQSYRNVFEKYDALITKNYQIPSDDLSEDVNTIIKQILTQILNFVYERLRSWYTDKNIPTRIFNAVLARRPTRFVDFDKRIAAVAHFVTLSEAEALSMAHKRVNNILQKSTSQSHADRFQVKLLREAAEKELFEQIEQKNQVITDLYKKANYKEIMVELATLKPAIDDFFDHVMVNVDDAKLKNNRIILLQQLQKMFLLVADISEL